MQWFPNLTRGGTSLNIASLFTKRGSESGQRCTWLSYSLKTQQASTPETLVKWKIRVALSWKKPTHASLSLRFHFLFWDAFHSQSCRGKGGSAWDGGTQGESSALSASLPIFWLSPFWLFSEIVYQARELRVCSCYSDFNGFWSEAWGFSCSGSHFIFVFLLPSSPGLGGRQIDCSGPKLWIWYQLKEDSDMFLPGTERDCTRPKFVTYKMCSSASPSVRIFLCLTSGDW